jgi:hypothetical protein
MLAGNHELCCSDSFSLLCFYQGDERCGRTHETWSGTLSPMMIDIADDQSASSPAAATHAPIPAPIRAPQFVGGMRSPMARSY